MKRKLLRSLLLCAVLAHTCLSAAEQTEFSFGVISHPLKSAPDDAVLRDAIEQTDSDNLAFVVANGIKAVDEPCTDNLYARRKALLHGAKNGLVVSLAASDWVECKNENGKSTAIGKLNHLRDLFFGDEFSIGATKIPVVRQSNTVKFRSFAENARWEIGDIMFATINLPGNNNHYVTDAGRNGEFEDRLVANRDWLHRLFTQTTRRKLEGIVLFCDGNPLSQSTSENKRDGYAETRRQITNLAAKFPGKVLIVHRQADKHSPSNEIHWQDNLGQLDAGFGWVKLTVSPSHPVLFSVTGEPAQARNNHQ
jgi:hypothetical protein